jgi:hypothetical protein
MLKENYGLSIASPFSPSPYRMTDFKGAVPQDVKAHVFVRGASKAKIRFESNSYLFVLL